MMSFSERNLWLKVGSGLGLAYALIFIITFIISVIYSAKKLNGPGFSKQVRRLVLKRHIITLVFFLISNFYLYMNVTLVTFYSTERLDKDFPIDVWWAKMFKIIFAA